MTRITPGRVLTTVLLAGIIAGVAALLNARLPETPEIRQIQDEQARHIEQRRVLESDLATPGRSPRIAAILTGPPDQPYRELVLHRLIEQANPAYVEEFLEMFDVATRGLESRMRRQEFILLPDERGNVHEATWRQKQAMEQMRREEPRRYQEIMASCRREVEYLDLAGQPARRREILRCLLYFGLLERTEDPRIVTALRDFFDRYVRVPEYLHEGRDLGLDRSLMFAYVKYVSIVDIIQQCVDQLSGQRTAVNEWPLASVERVIDYFTAIGQGLSQNFYMLFDRQALAANSIRIYVGVKVMQAIGFDDAELRRLLAQDFRPHTHWTIARGGQVVREIDIEQEIEQVLRHIHGKADVSAAAALKELIGPPTGEPVKELSQRLDLLGTSQAHKHRYIQIMAGLFLGATLLMTFGPRRGNVGVLLLPGLALLAAALAWWYLPKVDRRFYAGAVGFWPLAGLVLSGWLWFRTGASNGLLRSLVDALAGVLGRAGGFALSALRCHRWAAAGFAEADDLARAARCLARSATPASLQRLAGDGWYRPHLRSALTEMLRRRNARAAVTLAQRTQHLPTLRAMVDEAGDAALAGQLVAHLERPEEAIDLARRFDLADHLHQQRRQVQTLLEQITRDLAAPDAAPDAVLDRMDALARRAEALEPGQDPAPATVAQHLPGFVAYACDRQRFDRAVPLIAALHRLDGQRVDAPMAVALLRGLRQGGSAGTNMTPATATARMALALREADDPDQACAVLLFAMDHLQVKPAREDADEFLPVLEAALESCRRPQMPLVLLQLVRTSIESGGRSSAAQRYNALVGRQNRRIEAFVAELQATAQEQEG